MMNEIRLVDVKEILDGLLNEEITREYASEWAYNLRLDADNNILLYIPEDAEELLWESILFIEGIDLKNKPGMYFHNKDDIRYFLENIDLKN